MHNLLINTLIIRVNNYISYLKKLRDSLNEDEDIKKQPLIEKIKECHKISIKIGMSSFIKGIKELLPAKFLSNDIHEKINSQRNIFAFNNCLFDAKSKEFREISPNDYLTFTTGYDYYHDKVSQEKINEVNSILNSIFKNDIKHEWTLSQVEFVKNIFAGCLYGINHWQKIFIFTGSGSNGKTLIMKLFEIAFGGGYFKDIKSTFLTDKPTNSGSATAELVDKQYNHVLIVSEPEGELVSNTIKIHTGGDNIQSRGLYEKRVVSFQPKYTLFMLTNSIPKIKKPDSGFDRRPCVVEFPFKFVDNPTRDFEKLADRNLENKIKTDIELRNAFMWILIEQFKKMEFKKFITDAFTDEKTKDYINSLNPLSEYINEHLAPYIISGTTNKGYKSSLSYNYYKSINPNHSLSMKDFYEIMRYNQFISKTTNQGTIWCNLLDPESIEGKKAKEEWENKHK